MIDNQAKTHTNKHYFKDGITNVGSSKYSTCAVNRLLYVNETFEEDTDMGEFNYVVQFKFENSLEQFKDCKFALFTTGNNNNQGVGNFRRRMVRPRFRYGTTDGRPHIILTYKDKHTLEFRLTINNEFIGGQKFALLFDNFNNNMYYKPLESQGGYSNVFKTYAGIYTYEILPSSPEETIHKTTNLLAKVVCCNTTSVPDYQGDTWVKHYKAFIPQY